MIVIQSHLPLLIFDGEVSPIIFGDLVPPWIGSPLGLVLPPTMYSLKDFKPSELRSEVYLFFPPLEVYAPLFL